MDPLILGFEPSASQDLGDLQSQLSSEFTMLSVNVVRAWTGDSQDYFVVSPGPSVDQLRGIAAGADAALTGIARLVLDVSEPPTVDARALDLIVRPHLGVDVFLPSPDSFIDAEILVCPLCGGMNEHFSPPH